MKDCIDCPHFISRKKQILKEHASALDAAFFLREEIAECQTQHYYGDECFKKDVYINEAKQD